MPEDVLGPGGSAFFGVRNEDLPYSSERKTFSGPPPSLKDQGAMLLSALTGVVNTNRKGTIAFLKATSPGKSYGDPKAKSAACMDASPKYQSNERGLASTAKRLASLTSGDGEFPPEANFYEGRGMRRASQGATERSPRPRVASLTHIPRRMSVLQAAQLSDRRRSSLDGTSFRSPRLLRTPRRGPGKDEACDTSDIPINTLFAESDDELLIETVSSLDLERQRMEDPVKRNKLALEDYMGRLKETTNRLGLRASMLHELNTEDIESSYSTLPPPPKARKVSAPGSGPLLEFEEEEKPTASQHVKQARRLAGSMNVSQQTNGLRDIHSWLQHLGSIAQEEDFIDAGGPRSKQKDMERGEGDGAGDWRLPSSPAMALQLAQEDLRNRLGSLYSERQDVLNRQAELMAATTLATKEGEAEEVRLREFLRRMHMLEDEYHILGGKITDNLGEAEKLDKRHHRLRKDVKESDPHAGTVKSSEKGPSTADEDVHAEAKKKIGRKKTSKVEDSGLDEPVPAPHESKKKTSRRASQEGQADGAAGADPTPSPPLATVSVAATAPATVPAGGTVKTPSARGSLVKATPAPEATIKEDLEEYPISSGIDDDEKPELGLSETVSKLLEDSDDEHEESSDEEGPDFSDIEVKRKKSRKKTRVHDESGTPDGEDKEEESRRKRSGKRRAEGEARGSTIFDYDNVSSLYEAQSSQEAKVKYIKDDKKRSGATQRSALEWKILLESGQCKHRSCQTDPSITERNKKARSSQDEKRRASDSTSQMDAKELRREVVRLKQRLRFWRARNWAEQHKTQPIVATPAGLGPQYVTDDTGNSVLRQSSSETTDSRGGEAMTPNPYDLGGLLGSSSVRGSLRDSVSVSRSPLPDQETIIHEESLMQGGVLPDRTPSFVVFGRSPTHSPRDSRVGSLVPPARDSRVGSLVSSTHARTNSKGSVSIRRDTPPGAEALRLQTTAASLAERRTSN